MGSSSDALTVLSWCHPTHTAPCVNWTSHGCNDIANLCGTRSIYRVVGQRCAERCAPAGCVNWGAHHWSWCRASSGPCSGGAPVGDRASAGGARPCFARRCSLPPQKICSAEARGLSSTCACWNWETLEDTWVSCTLGAWRLHAPADIVQG